MKFLRCSSGISNPSIHDALVELLGNTIAESTVEVVSEGHWKLFTANESRQDLASASVPE